MKVMVQEIEELEVTDPAGLCNPPAPQIIPQPQRQLPQVPAPGPFNPLVPGKWTKPYLPFTPTPLPAIPGIGDIKPGIFPTIYTKHIHDPHDPLLRAKWGIGTPAIHQAGENLDADKWAKNWQAKAASKDGANGNSNTG